MRTTLFEITGLIALGMGSRLMPHLPNMTAISAVALKSTARFGTIGMVIPLTSMLLTDVIIGFYDWRLLVSVYVSFALIGMLGCFLRTYAGRRVAAVSITGSLLFFFITNTTVWALSSWYPHDVSGYLACLIAGIPFLIPMIVGDLLFSFTLFPQWIAQRWTVPGSNRLPSACHADALPSELTAL